MPEGNCLQSLKVLREAVLAAKRHEGGLKMLPCVELEPAWFARLRETVDSLVRENPGSDVTNPLHPTYWVRPYGKAKQYSLYNSSGRTDDTSTDFDGGVTAKSFRLERYVEVGELIRSFKGRLINFRLNSLAPNSGLSPHEEFIQSGDKVCLRFHLPVLTNARATLILDEEEFHFKEGIIYFFNKGCVHAAHNEGVKPRYHFVFDMWLDDWVFETLFDETQAATPHPRMRKLTALERQDLSVGRPRPVQEYVEGRSDGVLVLTRKRSDSSGEMNVDRQEYRVAWDIVEAGGPCRIGLGWYSQESHQGQFFRWAPDVVELEIAAERDGMATLVLDLEPGPGVASGRLRLLVSDEAGCEMGEFSVSGRQSIRCKVALHKGVSRIFLRSLNGGRRAGGDPRVLNFRAFSVSVEG
jgi:hypothetical protein